MAFAIGGYAQLGVFVPRDYPHRLQVGKELVRIRQRRRELATRKLQAPELELPVSGANPYSDLHGFNDISIIRHQNELYKHLSKWPSYCY